MEKSLLGIVKDYCLQHDLRDTSERQVRAVASVYLHWRGCADCPIETFTADSISELLAAKQRAGRSSHYRRSLRNTLKAVYRFAHADPQPIRPVKLSPLEPESWLPAEVAAIISALDSMRLTTHERTYWRTMIAAGYYTGLNRCDLARLRLSDIQPDGTMYVARSKTGRRVCVRIPLELVAEITAWHTGDQPIWEPYRSSEAERVQFNRIVAHANLSGSFKKLRKSSGTQVELLHPGRGHEQLGNSREIFDAHYGDRRVLSPAPVMPPQLRAYG
jgi:integrase